MAQRTLRLTRPDDYLFYPNSNPRPRKHFSENRLRQIFRRYLLAAGLDRSYARDRQGRVLHELTIHSLRHSHIMHYVHVYKLPLPIVQKQVGHKSLKTTSIYLRPSDEQVGQAYEEARHSIGPVTNRPKSLKGARALSFHNDTDR